MNEAQFKEVVNKTWNKELNGHDRKTHAVLTVTTEAAEIADIWKKAAFSNRPDKLGGIDMLHLAQEIGDLLYGVEVVCREFGLDQDFCRRKTADKLEVRYAE